MKRFRLAHAVRDSARASVRAISLALPLAGLFAACFAAGGASLAAFSIAGSPPREWRGDLNDYIALSQAEKRLVEYADSREVLALKLEQLECINASRKKHGAGPLRLDILASRVANRAAQEACSDSYRGHWNLRGEKPYHRYAFAGGVDHVTENAASSWSSSPFQNTSGSLAALMKKAHEGFMAETPPNDGHKRTVVDRYLEFVEVKCKVSPGERFRIAVKPMSETHRLHMIVAYYEPFPKPMTPAQINGTGAYLDFTSERALVLAPLDLKAFREKGVYTIPLEFDKTGLYYLHMYLDDREFTQGTATTRGKIQASGLVIRCG